MPRLRLMPATLIVLLCASPVAAETGASPPSMLKTWQIEWNARLRQESVVDDAFASNAGANTLRLRAGIRLNWANGFNALLEAEGIADAGDGYNSGANGRTTRPAVIDPEGAEWNQAFLGWHGKKVSATLGRQRLQFDNQRWIGNSGWRQNEQTFDALATDWHITPTLLLRAGWLERVHRVNGDEALDPLARERRLSTQVWNLGWTHATQQLVGYAYLHDDHDVPTASTVTSGVRWNGSALHDGTGFGYTLEAARQHAYSGNPLSFSHAYWLVEPTFAAHGVTYRLGWEHLGGDGAHALQTPLATLHAFNGWADKFTVTPPGGLEDRYVGASGMLAGNTRRTWLLAWHDFHADTGGRFGSEWDLSFGFPVHGPVTGLVKLADYRSDGFARDTQKLWLQLEWTGKR